MTKIYEILYQFARFSASLHHGDKLSWYEKFEIAEIDKIFDEYFRYSCNLTTQAV